jgi:hypothetical protein
VLYQLSYASGFDHPDTAGEIFFAVYFTLALPVTIPSERETGLEPATSSLEG